MLITSFDKPIIFRVTDELKDSTESIIRKWVEIDNINKTRNQYYLDQFYETCFPLIWLNLYVICIKWATPCCPYIEYKTHNKEYYWISIDKESNLNDFDALLSLQYKSSQKLEIVENDELAKNQLIEGKENLTIKTL